MTGEPKRWLEEAGLDEELRSFLAEDERGSEALPDWVGRNVERRLAASLLLMPTSLKVLGVTKAATSSASTSGAGALGGGTVSSGAAATTGSVGLSGSGLGSAGIGSTGVSTVAASSTTGLAAAGTAVGGASLVPAASGIASTVLGSGLLSGLSAAKVAGVLSLVVAAGSSTGYVVHRAATSDEQSSESVVDEHPLGEASSRGANGREEALLTGARDGTPTTTPGNALSLDDLSQDNELDLWELTSSASDPSSEAAESEGAPTAGAERLTSGARETQAGAPPNHPASIRSGQIRSGQAPSNQARPEHLLPERSRTASASTGAGTVRGASSAALREEVFLLKRARLALETDRQQAREILLLYRHRFPRGALRAEYEALLARTGQ